MAPNILNIFKKFIRFIPQKLINRFINLQEIFGNKYYSLEGEDIVLGHIFATQNTGFYLDIGAFDPVTYSNTFLLYQRGWSGINIEPRPGTKLIFDQKRPRDVTLEMGVSSQKGDLTYYIFNDGAVNTFEEENVQFQINGGYKLIAKKKIPVDTLTNILDKYAKDKIIDFMSLDVEGHELMILKTLDWERYRPKVICVEMFRLKQKKNSLFKYDNRDLWLEINEISESEVYKLLLEKRYKLFAKTICSAIFVNVDSGL